MKSSQVIGNSVFVASSSPLIRTAIPIRVTQLRGLIWRNPFQSGMFGRMNPARTTDNDYIDFLIASPAVVSATEAARVQPIRPHASAHDSFTR